MALLRDMVIFDGGSGTLDTGADRDFKATRDQFAPWSAVTATRPDVTDDPAVSKKSGTDTKGKVLSRGRARERFPKRGESVPAENLRSLPGPGQSPISCAQMPSLCNAPTGPAPFKRTLPAKLRVPASASSGNPASIGILAPPSAAAAGAPAKTTAAVGPTVAQQGVAVAVVGALVLFAMSVVKGGALFAL